MPNKEELKTVSAIVAVVDYLVTTIETAADLLNENYITKREVLEYLSTRVAEVIVLKNKYTEVINRAKMEATQ
jgi:hypothetical protein